MVSYKKNDNQIKCTLIDVFRGKIRKSVGYAHCNPSDNFDEKIGQKIAFLRARIVEISRNIESVRGDRCSLDAQYKSYCDALDRKIERQAAERDRLRRELGDIVLHD